jgi:uncharacterized zinc-type alcohol dehydrogenase-like protein
MTATTTIEGYAARAVGQSLEPFRYELPKLGDHDVRVSITHCGVCHTDILGINDYFEITTFPFVPGHEIVGFISEVGGEVTSLKEGDRVGIGWQGRSCNHCEWCLREDEHLCQEIDKMGTWRPYGGFSSSVVLEDRFAYPLPEAIPSETAAVLMCAGITVYSALRPYAAQPAKKLGIIGVGGLGHLAIQYAHTFGYEVTAISSTAGKKEEALAFGADHFIFSGELDQLRQAYYSLDLLLCTIPGKVDWDPLMMTLKKKERLILVGFPDVTLNSTILVAHQLSITSSFLGNRATMREMLSFSQEHGIKPAVELMPMSQVNAALQMVKENKARYRVVLVNDAVGTGT